MKDFGLDLGIWDIKRHTHTSFLSPQNTELHAELLLIWPSTLYLYNVLGGCITANFLHESDNDLRRLTLSEKADLIL